MRDRANVDLFIVSWLVLFLELTCIRWFPSHVMFLTFFTNIVLLACFVGMSVGCLAARNTTRYLNRTPFWLVLAVVAGLVVENNRDRLFQMIAIGDRANPDVVFFGAEAGDNLTLPFRIPLEVVAGAFFLLIAIVLVGPGQEMGRAFNRVASQISPAAGLRVAERQAVRNRAGQGWNRRLCFVPFVRRDQRP